MPCNGRSIGNWCRNLCKFSQIKQLKGIIIFTIGTGIDGEIFEPNWEGTEEKGVRIQTRIALFQKIHRLKITVMLKVLILVFSWDISLPKDAYVTYSNNNDKQYKSNAEVLKDLGYNNEEEYIKALTAETEILI